MSSRQACLRLSKMKVLGAGVAAQGGGVGGCTPAQHTTPSTTTENHPHTLLLNMLIMKKQE